MVGRKVTLVYYYATRNALEYGIITEVHDDLYVVDRQDGGAITVKADGTVPSWGSNGSWSFSKT